MVIVHAKNWCEDLPKIGEGMTDTESQQKRLSRKRLLEFCAKHPDDPVFRFRLAESYMETENKILAIYSARKAHALFVAEKNNMQSKAILKQFGKDADSSKKHYVSDTFIRLSNERNMISRKMKQVKLKEGTTLYKKGDLVDYLYLVVEGELAVLNKMEDKHVFLLKLGSGNLAFEYDAAPKEHHTAEAYDDEYDDESLNEGERAYKTVMYRGTKTKVYDDAPKAEKKPVMYRGSVVADSNQESSVRAEPTTYRGNQVDKELYKKHRYATVIAQKDCTLLKFTPQEIKKELQEYNLHNLFEKEAPTRFKLAKIAGSELFINLPISLIALIAKLTKLSAYNQGDELKKAGELFPCVKLVVQGHVHFYEEEADGSLSYCGRTKEGEILGLDALFSKQPSKYIYQAELGCETIDIDYNILKDISVLSTKFKSTIRAFYARTVTNGVRLD